MAQAAILEKNLLTTFVPCSGHSSNLVGQVSVTSCFKVVKLFDIVKAINTFIQVHRNDGMCSKNV